MDQEYKVCFKLRNGDYITALAPHKIDDDYWGKFTSSTLGYKILAVSNAVLTENNPVDGIYKKEFKRLNIYSKDIQWVGVVDDDQA